MTNQSLTLQFGKHGQRLLNRRLRRLRHASHPEIYDLDRIESQMSQVVMNSVDQLLAGEGMNPGFVPTAASAHLADDHQTIRVGMKRLPDELIGHMRTVK